MESESGLTWKVCLKAPAPHLILDELVLAYWWIYIWAAQEGCMESLHYHPLFKNMKTKGGRDLPRVI